MQSERLIMTLNYSSHKSCDGLQFSYVSNNLRMHLTIVWFHQRCILCCLLNFETSINGSQHVLVLQYILNMDAVMSINAWQTLMLKTLLYSNSHVEEFAILIAFVRSILKMNSLMCKKWIVTEDFTTLITKVSLQHGLSDV